MNKENILKLADHQGLFDYFDLEGDSVGQLMLYTLVLDCMASEREACAKVCEEAADLFGNSGHIGVCITNAGAIRSRGNQ